MNAKNIYVQYGCGLSAPEGWLNFDSSPTLRLQRLPLLGGVFRRTMKPRFPDAIRVGDIVIGLPIERNSATGIYCSHVLEHLSLADLRTALRNTRSYLRKDGIFRLVLPDLRKLAEDYMSRSGPEAAHRFMVDAHLGHDRRERGVKGFLRAALGNSRHLWMWDYESLAEELDHKGFKGIRRAGYHDSADPMFNGIEDEGRWVDNLGIECFA